MRRIHYLTGILAFITLVAFMPAASHANLALTPTLVSFEEGERFKDVTLINNTAEPQTYEMSWAFFEMQETGASYKKIDQSLSDFDVSKTVFFTPRRVTIPGNGAQKVRLAFRRPSDVPAGEYVAHLLFSPAAKPEIDDTQPSTSQAAAAGVAVRVGFSIPVVVRIGAFEETARIGEVTLRRSESNTLVLDTPIIRPDGEYGVIGHLYVYHLDGGAETLIGEVSNANVFTEITQRIIPVTLTEDVKGGTLKIVLKSGKADSDIILAQKTLPLE